MFQTQQIQLNQENFDKLLEFYTDHHEHHVRQRAHLVLLRSKNYSVSAIGDVLGLEDNYVSLYIKAWYHFELEGFLSNDPEKLYNRIKELETSEPIEDKPLIVWAKLFGHIGEFFKSIYFFFEKIILTIATAILTLFLWIGSKVKAIDYKKYYIPFNTSVSNKLNINKDSNNNIVFQMINVFNGEAESESENRIASTLEDTKKQFLDIFQKQKEYLSDSQMIALFLALNDKVQQIEDKEKRKRILAVLATAAAMYVYYNTAIKGGLVLFTFLSITFTIFNFNSTVNSRVDSIVEKDENANLSITDSVRQVQEREKFIIDSLMQEEGVSNKIDFIIRQQEISDSLAQIEIIEGDDDCYYFAKKNEYVKRLIEEDSTDYESEKYFVKLYDQDEKFFVITSKYDDVREAAFQRRYLIGKGFRRSMIIELRENGEIKYGLSVDEFTEAKFDDALYQINNWGILCEKYKPKIYHNGFCKLQ